MSNQGSSPGDYEEIERAMLATERGRWFLAEYARRSRNTDTDKILEQIFKLHSAMTEIGENNRQTMLIRDLQDMQRHIIEARNGISALKPRMDLTAQFQTAEYDAADIPGAMERAGHDITAAVDGLQAIAMGLRKQGVDNDFCDEIETHARGIFMAAAFQDITNQRSLRLLEALRYLEQRVNAALALAENEELAAAS